MDTLRPATGSNQSQKQTDLHDAIDNLDAMISQIRFRVETIGARVMAMPPKPGQADAPRAVQTTYYDRVTGLRNLSNEIDELLVSLSTHI